MATAKSDYPTKEYQVTRTVKVGGDEHGPGKIVKLTQAQADRLLGVFVDEYVAPVEDKTPSKGKTGKAGTGSGDGL